MSELQQLIYETLCGLSGEEVANLMLDWHGTQILDCAFANFLVDEGYLEVDEDELWEMSNKW